MRRTQLLAAGLFVVLGAVTACQSGTAGAGAPPSAPTLSTSISGSAPTPPLPTSPLPTSPPVTTTPTAGGAPPVIAHPPTVLPIPSQPRTTVPAGQIQSGSMTNPPRNVQVSSDGRYIVFTAEQAGCELITAQATTQTPAQVTIQVTTTSNRRGTQMCPMIVREVYVVVQLAAPLAARTIVFQGINGH